MRHHKFNQTASTLEKAIFNSHPAFHTSLQTIVVQIGLMDAAAIQPLDSSQSLPIEQFHQMAAAARDATSLALQKVSLATLGFSVFVRLYFHLIVVDSLSALRRDLDERISQVRTQLEEVQDLKKKSFSLYTDRKRETLDRLTEARRQLCVSLLLTPCPGPE